MSPHPDLHDSTWNTLKREFGSLSLTDKIETVKKINKEIAEHDFYIREAWRLSNDLQAVTSPDRRFLITSPSWCRELGWGEADLRDQDWQDFVHPEDLPSAAEKWNLMLPGDEVRQVFVRLRSRDGLYVWTSSNAVRFPDGRCYSATRTLLEADPRIAALVMERGAGH
jgi:PAS domain S-box-containing protein